MTASSSSSAAAPAAGTDAWYASQFARGHQPTAGLVPDRRQQHSADRTSRTDDERIKDITVLPPPEHLIRFFPIRARQLRRSSPKPATTFRTSWPPPMTACWW